MLAQNRTGGPVPGCGPGIEMRAACFIIVILLICSAPNALPASLDTGCMSFQDISKVVSHQDQAEECQCTPVHLCSNSSTGDFYGENVLDIRLGEAGCSHYYEKCCSPVSEPNQPSPTPSYNPTCGYSNMNGVGFKITGNYDNEANYGEFPWMVALLQKGQNEYKMVCGGSLIHPQVVLTGVHCVKGKKNITVRAGEWDTKTAWEEFPTQDRGVQRIIIHEEYYAAGLRNDIALLLLDSPFNLTKVVSTVCLPEKEEDMDVTNCVVTGWGKDAFGDNTKYQAILKRVELPLVPKNECEAILRTTALGPKFKLHDSLLCAGGQIGKDSCKGDGGGPLVCPSKGNPNKYLQVGIVAWGIGCGNAIPATYVNIPYFRSWVDNKMDSLYLNKSPYLE